MLFLFTTTGQMKWRLSEVTRPKKKPDYNPEQIMREFMESVADAFGEYDDRKVPNAGDNVYGEAAYSGKTSTLNAVADDFGITALKARKLLITAGAYSTETSRRVQQLSARLSIQEIMEATGLSRASVHSYLPYKKLPYNMKELSTTAERTRLYRARKSACSSFMDNIADLSVEEQDAALWELLEFLQGCVFYTFKGLKFTYEINGGELFVNRKDKSVTRATVNMAFHKALDLSGAVSGPKKLGTFGASYLYPVFMRIGVIK
jgi:hypothetical protein